MRVCAPVPTGYADAMSEVKNVAVIGGGLAGLAAAVSLVRAGLAVHVYEAAATAGGRMRSDRLGDATVDPSVQLVSSTYTSFFELARICGAADLLVRAPGRDALWRAGRAHGITYGSVTSMVGSGALPPGLKLKLGTRYLPFLATTARTLDANDPAATAGVALDDESVAAWGAREMGSDFVELLAYPLLAAYYGCAPEDVTAALYHALARVGMDVRVHAVRGGAGALPRAIVSWLLQHGAVVRTNTRVASTGGGDRDGVRVELQNETAVHDAAIIATTATAARALLPARGAIAAWLAEVRTAPTATAAFLLDAPLERDWFGLSFPRGSEPGERIAAITAQSRKLQTLVPAGREVVVVYPAPAIAARLARATPQETVDELMPALETALPGFGARVERARVYPFTDGYAVFHPGYLRRLRAFDERWLPARIALAGDYLVAPSVEGAVRSGLKAARRLLGPAPPADSG
ncbi:MAG: FAD-dependent oxidoreductase, partial [Longimicrobiales bacterium]